MCNNRYSSLTLIFFIPSIFIRPDTKSPYLILLFQIINSNKKSLRKELRLIFLTTNAIDYWSRILFAFLLWKQMYLFSLNATKLPLENKKPGESHNETIRTLCWLVYVPKADATRLGEMGEDANQLLAVGRKQLITVWSARGCHGNAAAVARIHCQSSPLPYWSTSRFRFTYSENVNSWDIHMENVIEILLPNTQSNLYFITDNRFVADRLDRLKFMK